MKNIKFDSGVSDGVKKMIDKVANGVSTYVKGNSSDDEIDIVWGNVSPRTDMSSIYLPENGEYPYEEYVSLKAGLHHEIAHLYCKTPTDEMWDWINKWKKDGPKNEWDDEYNIIYEVAENVIQLTEDCRIESIYSSTFPGIHDVFKYHRPKTNEIIETPSTAYHGYYSGREDDVKREWDQEYCRFFDTTLQSVSKSSIDATFWYSEEVMDFILPWYIDVIQSNNEDLKERVKKIESSQKFKTQTGHGHDYDPDNVEVSDVEGLENYTNKDEHTDRDQEEIREKSYPFSVSEMPALGDKTGEVDSDTAREIVNLVRRIRTRNENTFSHFGSEIDIDEYIHDDMGKSEELEFMIEEKSRNEFDLLILLDLSYSMKGEKMKKSRDVVCTILSAFNGISNFRPDYNFKVFGFAGGGRISTVKELDEINLGIKEVRTMKQCKRIGLAPNYSSTPIPEAIRYSSDELTDTSESRTIILISDGKPTSGESIGEAIRNTSAEVDRIISRNINFAALCIDVSLTQQQLNKAYRNYYNADSIDECMEKLIEIVREELVSYSMS